MTKPTKLYQCLECGLHYVDKAKMKECQAFCSTHHACSMDITKYSVEEQQLVQKLKGAS